MRASNCWRSDGDDDLIFSHVETPYPNANSIWFKGLQIGGIIPLQSAAEFICTRNPVEGGPAHVEEFITIQLLDNDDLSVVNTTDRCPRRRNLVLLN